MTISNAIRSKVEEFPEGYVFKATDFDFEPEKRQAVSKTLQRLAKAGIIKAISKGKYYKPRISIFGPLKPSPAQMAREFYVKDGKIIGYPTGMTVFSHYALTTQISGKIEIGTNKPRKPIKSGITNISFIRQKNTITEENVEILMILDVLRFINDIPATTADKACRRMTYVIRDLSDDKKKMLVDCAMNYSQSVRALCGAILELNGVDESLLSELRKTISGASKTRYPIYDDTLPTKKNWRIYEPARK